MTDFPVGGVVGVCMSGCLGGEGVHKGVSGRIAAH